MKLRRILNMILNESINDDLNEIIKKLEGYEKEYHSENLDYSNTLKIIVQHLKNRKFPEALDALINSDVRYDIPKTSEELRKIINAFDIEINYGNQWGTKPGEYFAFRAGKVENVPNGIFFSITKKAAESYSKTSGDVHRYSVQINKPAVFKDAIEGISKFTNKTRDQVLLQRDRSKNVGDWWLNADKMMVNLAKKKGFDSIAYTDPAPPAIRELVIFNKSQATLLE